MNKMNILKLNLFAFISSNRFYRSASARPSIFIVQICDIWIDRSPILKRDRRETQIKFKSLATSCRFPGCKSPSHVLSNTRISLILCKFILMPHRRSSWLGHSNVWQIQKKSGFNSTYTTTHKITTFIALASEVRRTFLNFITNL